MSKKVIKIMNMTDNRAPRVGSRGMATLRASLLNGGLAGGVSRSVCAVALALGGGLSLLPTAAQAGTCVQQGTSGSFLCSGGAADTDTMQAASDSVADSPVVVTTTPGFGLNAAANSLGSALGITGFRFNGTTFIDNNAAVITGDDAGIAIENDLGELSLTSTGTVIGIRDRGISATNRGTRFILSANNTSGGNAGIVASNVGTAETAITSSGTATGGVVGISVTNFSTATGLTVTANDTNGGLRGIFAINGGTGALSITSSGTAAATAPNIGLFGIEATNLGTSLTITANRTSGGSAGISAGNFGTGGLIITSTGPATGTGPNGVGITATNQGTDLTIMASDTSGGMGGISVVNNGTGPLSIESTGTAASTGPGGVGISAVNDGPRLTVTANHTTGGNAGIMASHTGPGPVLVTSSGRATGGNFGIFIQNDGAGPTSLSVTGTVTGGTGAAIATHSGAGGEVSINLAPTAIVETGAAGSGLAIVDAGAGNATVTINRATVNGAILLGDGNDTLTITSGTSLDGVTRLSGDTGAMPGQLPGDGGALRTTSDASLAGGRGSQQGASVGGFTDTLNLNTGFTGDLNDFEMIGLDTGGGSFTLNGVISNANSVTKTGTGTLTLSGISSFTGPTTVTGGSLNVTGMIASSPVTLQSGASLTGTGTVGGVIAQSGSTVSPGAASGGIGMLSINGNLTLAAGSTLAVDISTTGQDQVVVAGTAMLGGALVIAPTAAMGFNQTLDFLSAASVTGSFASTTVGGAFGSAFAPRVVINGTRVSLQLAPNSLVMLGGGALRGNTLALATAFDSAVMRGANPQAFMGLFTQGANLPTALNQFTGELHSVERRVALEDTRAVRVAVFDRLNGGLSSPAGSQSATKEDGERTTTLWLQASAATSTAQTDGNGSRFTSDRTGVLFGGDIVSNSFTFGGLFSYVESDVDLARRDESKVRSVGIAVFGGYRQPGSGFAVGAGGALADMRFKGRRAITIPGLIQSLSSRSGGTTYQLFGEVSYDLSKAETTNIGPFLRAAYARIESGRILEKGGAAAVNIAKQSNDLTTIAAGLRATHVAGKTTLSGAAGYQRLSGDRSASTDVSIVGTTNPFSIRSTELDRDAAAFEAQASFQLLPRVRLGLGYSGVIGRKNTNHGGRGTFTLAL